MMNYCQNILTLGKLNLRAGTTSFVSRPSSLVKEVMIGGILIFKFGIINFLLPSHVDYDADGIGIGRLDFALFRCRGSVLAHLPVTR